MKELCLTPEGLRLAANDDKSGETPARRAEEKQVADALDTLKKLPMTGKPLMDLVARRKIDFCALDKLPGGVAAQYLASSRLVVSGPVGKGENRVLQLAHELTHAAQDENGLLSYSLDWTIEMRVERNTAVEAAAMTMEFLTAYDAKLAGDDGYWKDMQRSAPGLPYGDAKMYSLIDDTYKAGVAAGKTQQESLREAGAAAWKEIFQSADWRRFYLDVELMNYLRDIDNGSFAPPLGPKSAGYTQAALDAAGQIGSGESFTKGAAIYSLQSMLQGEQKMAWAFQAADIARYAQQLGADDPSVLSYREKAKADGNPYLGLDMKKMYVLASDASWRKSHADGRPTYVYEVLDAALAAQNPAAQNPAVLPAAGGASMRAANGRPAPPAAG